MSQMRIFIQAMPIILLLSTASAHPQYSYETPRTTKKPDAVIYIVPDDTASTTQHPYAPARRRPYYSEYRPKSYDVGLKTYDLKKESGDNATSTRPLSVPITTHRPTGRRTDNGYAPPGYGYVYSVCYPYCRRIYRRRYVLPICYPV